MGAWAAQLLDTGTGNVGSVLGANARGDLAGYVSTRPCNQPVNCSHAVVWSADAGTALDIGTLGSDYNVAKDINSAGEVVGVSTANGRSVAYLWSASLGTRELPVQGSDAVARAVSDVRPDGTRLVVGVAGAQAAVWVVRNP